MFTYLLGLLQGSIQYFGEAQVLELHEYISISIFAMSLWFLFFIHSRETQSKPATYNKSCTDWNWVRFQLFLHHYLQPVTKQ